MPEMHLELIQNQMTLSIGDIQNQFIEENDFWVEIYAFPQTWPTSAIGLPGIAVEIDTKAQTVVAMSATTFKARVYFGGRFAYQVEQPNERFYNDLNDRFMKSARECQGGRLYEIGT